MEDEKWVSPHVVICYVKYNSGGKIMFDFIENRGYNEEIQRIFGGKRVVGAIF